MIDLMRQTRNWSKMRPGQREALRMIVHKQHRILTGNPDHEDHWDDIAGYAHLGMGKPANAPTAPTIDMGAPAGTFIKPKRKYVRRLENGRDTTEPKRSYIRRKGRKSKKGAR